MPKLSGDGAKNYQAVTKKTAHLIKLSAFQQQGDDKEKKKEDEDDEKDKEEEEEEILKKAKEKDINRLEEKEQQSLKLCKCKLNEGRQNAQSPDLKNNKEKGW